MLSLARSTKVLKSFAFSMKLLMSEAMLDGNSMLMGCMFAIAVACKLREARIEVLCSLHVVYMHAGCKLRARCANAARTMHPSDVSAARSQRAHCLQLLQAMAACAAGGIRKSPEFCRKTGAHPRGEEGAANPGAWTIYSPSKASKLNFKILKKFENNWMVRIN